MDDGVLIRPFLDFDDDVDIIWPRQFVRSEENQWQVIVTIWRHRSPGPEAVNLPIGYMPLLRPGRCFSKGRLSEIVRCGSPGSFRVDNLGRNDWVSTSDMDMALLSRLAPLRKGSRKPLAVFVFDSDGMRIYVPAVELVRAFFLSRAVMANAIMRPQSLMELCVVEGAGDELQLNFTREMPVGLLRGRDGAAFIRQFAWIMTDRRARESWESVWFATTELDGAVDFNPPPLRDVHFNVRWVRHGDSALVVEILALFGPQLGMRKLFVTHPDLKESARRSPAPSQADAESGEEGREDATQNQTVARRFVVENHGAPGGAGRQRRINVDLPTPIAFSDAEVIPLRRPVREEGEQASTSSGTGTRSAARPADPGSVTTVRIEASVAERSAGSALAPMDFRLLPAFVWTNHGDLDPLIAITDWMADVLPAVRIGRQITIVPRSTKSVSLIVNRSRPVLVVVLHPIGGLPRVLIDVDHSDGINLSMLAIFYAKDVALREIENDVLCVLDGLVERNGHWDLGSLAHRSDVLEWTRMPSVLRNRAAFDDDAYVTKWGLELIKRMGIAGFL